MSEIKNARELCEALTEIKALTLPDERDRVLDLTSGIVAYTERHLAHELAEKIEADMKRQEAGGQYDKGMKRALFLITNR